MNSRVRGDLVLKRVCWDPVRAFEENRFPIDAEIKAEARRPGDGLLDQLSGAEIHLQERLL